VLKLEAGALGRLAAGSPGERLTFPGGYVDAMRRLAALGHFEREPDFARALEWYDAAADGTERERRFGWLFELLERVESDAPPVTEAEFAELAQRFAAHERERGPRESYTLGERAVYTGSVRYGLAQGPRQIGAGQLAEDVRQILARDM
jgi:hypothetical protein